MRTRLWLQAALTLGAFVLPYPVLAQFHPPTNEELKMTAEPKAPGAAAIYLYREETVDDNLHYHSFFTRIKVLTEKGKELATVGIPYPRGVFQITDINARTIHSDGTIIPLAVKPSDLMEQKVTGVQINRMVFTLPSVEVGSILEYRWQLRYDDNTLSSPDWDVQQKYFLRKAHYFFVPFNRLDNVTNERGESSGKLLSSSLLPLGVKVVRDAGGRYTLDVNDVLPIPDEEFMPPIASLLEQVVFYYSPYLSKDDYWKNEGNRWSKEMDHFASESRILKDAVSKIVSPTDSQSAKALKIYDAVLALDNTDYTRRKSAAELKQLGMKQTKSAEDVWNRKSGSRDEIALLYLAMARIAGLKAYAMTVANRDRTLFNPYFLSMRQFDDVIILLSVDGKEVMLDPGEKCAPFGQIHWSHALTAGLRQSDNGTVLAETPGNAYKEASTVRNADLTIAPDGGVTGYVRISMRGPEALRWRHVAIENDETEVKKRFNESVNEIVPDGVHAEFDHFLGLNDYNSTLMGIVKISGNVGTTTGKRVFLPGAFFASQAKHPFVAQENRRAAVDMSYADLVKDDVTYDLPDAYVIESAPPDNKTPWEGHAIFAMKASSDQKSVTLVRSLARAFTLLEPKEYPALRDFYQKIATADQQQLILTAAPSSHGN